MPSEPHADAQSADSAATFDRRRPDQRRSVRDAIHGEPARPYLVRLVLGTYAEMPGLSLQLPQAARLFGLRETTCRVLLDDLVRVRRLRKSSDGQYRAFQDSTF